MNMREIVGGENVHGAIYLLIMPFQMLSSCSVIAWEKRCIISEGLMLFVIRLKTVFAEHSPQISLVSEGPSIRDRNPNGNLTGNKQHNKTTLKKNTFFKQCENRTN